ncbi:MAG: M48 family metalloprotease [Burkholderiales bacterium]
MLLAWVLFAAGCTVNPHVDREMLTAPTAVSDAYSQVNMHLRLATSVASNEQCNFSGCMESAQFDERVSRIGARLAAAAYVKYPDLIERVSAFEFIVVDKVEPGTVSTAGGMVAVLRPVSAVARSDEALSFVLAREIGHVVARHHEENTGTSILVSVLATVLAPVTTVLKALATVYQGATTAIASASVTAASFASSKVLIATYRPRQLDEADRIALELLSAAGMDTSEVRSGFSEPDLRAFDEQWLRDLQKSVNGLAQRVVTPAPHRIPADATTAQAAAMVAALYHPVLRLATELR